MILRAGRRALALASAGVLAAPAGAAAVALAAPIGANARVVVVRVRGVPVRTTSARCAFVIRARVVGGGSQTTCLETVAGFPGPGAVIRSRGVMTFALRGGAITARVRVTQRFRRDGVHALQALLGTVVGGTGAFAHAGGTITGGGPVVDRRSGLGAVDLRYRIALR